MIRNDRTVFEVQQMVAIGDDNGGDLLSALAWLYAHTHCIVTGYMTLRMLVIWARSQNRYLTPDRTLAMAARGGRTGFLSEEFISNIRDVLNEMDFRMRMNDERFLEDGHLPETYREEFLLLKRIAQIQLEQEFVYVDIHGDVAPTIAIRSVCFDWTDIQTSFLKERGFEPEHVTITDDRGQTRRADFVEQRLAEGKSVHSILCEAGYGWDRALQRIEWLRRKGRLRPC